MSAGVQFATLDIATALLGIYNSTNNEKLKISAAVSVSHICKLNPSIFPTIFESITCVNYCAVLCEAPQRIQQAFVTMLNIALTQPYPKLNDSLMEEPKFKEAMYKLLIENSYFVIRGKCVLTILLLFKINPYWIILVEEFKFYSSCDRMSRDYSKYIQYCLLCLIDGVLELTPKLVGLIKKDFTNYMKDKSAFDADEDTVPNRVMRELARRCEDDNSNSKLHQFRLKNLHGNLVLLVAVFDLLQSQLFRNKIINKDLIVLIGHIIDKTEEVENDTVNDIKFYTLLILENLCTNVKAIIVHNKAIVEHILPQLIKELCINKNEKSNSQLKFMCLKSFTDLITQYLGDENIYDADGTQETTKKINEMILKRLFPNYGSILSDDDPLPNYGLRLLCVIVERNSAFVTILKKLKLVDIMLEYFAEDHPRFSTHLIKIVCSIVESKELKLEDFQEYELVPKLNDVLRACILKKNDSCLDNLLDIVYELLHYIAETLKEQYTEVAEETFRGLVNENFEMCIKLLESKIPHIVEKASQNLIGFIQISTMTKNSEAKVVFLPAHLPSMLKALDFVADEKDKKTIAKRILKCIFWGMNQANSALKLSDKDSRIKEKLVQICAKNVNSSDNGLQATAVELKKLLE